MRHDPFARLPTTGRLWAAAVLCIAPLGLVWSTAVGVQTPGYVGSMTCDADGFCTVGPYYPGLYIPGHAELVSQSSARVFLLGAAALLALVATRVRTPATRRLARLATGLLLVAALLAASQRATLTLVCMVTAVALVAPLVWNRGPMRPVLAPGDLRR